MCKKFILILLLTCFQVQAAPDKLDVVFLSHSFTSTLLDLVRPKHLFYRSQVAITFKEAKKTCTPMGEGCFHPQYGFLEDDDVEKKPIKLEKNEIPVLRTINALETDLVNCDKDNYFDIYCGKAKKVSKPAPIELWVDISSSMRNVDQDMSSKTCYRKIFVNNILDKCPKDKVDVLVYHNSIKQMGSTNTLCLSYGMNSPKRFKDWVQASTAKHLFVITDIDEMNTELSEFLTKMGANITGIGAKDFSAKNLEEYAKDFISTCQNK